MKVIMTASRKNNYASTNAAANAALCNTVDMRLGITAIPVRGVWKGESEDSFLFAGVKPVDLYFLHNLANAAEQDAILMVRDDNRCFLVLRNGETEDVGDWHKVPENIAVQFDGYSVIGGDYYIAAHVEEIHAAQRRLLSTQAALIAANEYEARLAAASGYVGV